MNIISVINEEELGKQAGEIVAEAVKAKPDLVIGLATGSSPLPLYRDMIGRCEAGELDFSGVTSVNLDEYVGLPPTHEQSYRYFMIENLFGSINIDPANTHVPLGTADDLEAECARYDALIDDLGGIDLQVLGIGINGHIGFNEPSDTFSKNTQVAHLTENTVNANARFFDDPADVPREALTLDIRHIMLAKKIILVAGPEKKDIVDQAFCGDITPQIPASALQMHPDTTVIIISPGG